MTIHCLIEEGPNPPHTKVRAFEDREKADRAMLDRMIELDKVGWAGWTLTLISAEVET